MAARQDKKTQTREKLIKAAAECFAEKGYAGCSVADIVERAQMSKGSLYVHFASKEALFNSMIEEEHQRGAEKAQRLADKPPYLAAVIAYMAECIGNERFPIDHRLWTEVLAVAARDQIVRQAFVASERVNRKFFVGLLKKAAEAGEIDGSLDLEAVAIWLYALGDGLIARTADDPTFDFQKHFQVFEALVKRALGASV